MVTTREYLSFNDVAEEYVASSVFTTATKGKTKSYAAMRETKTGIRLFTTWMQDPDLTLAEMTSALGHQYCLALANPDTKLIKAKDGAVGIDDLPSRKESPPSGQF